MSNLTPQIAHQATEPLIKHWKNSRKKPQQIQLWRLDGQYE